MSQCWRVISTGQVFTLSCRDHKESESRPEEVPRDRARGPRAESEIHTCWEPERQPWAGSQVEPRTEEKPIWSKPRRLLGGCPQWRRIAS